MAEDLMVESDINESSLEGTRRKVIALIQYKIPDSLGRVDDCTDTFSIPTKPRLKLFKSPDQKLIYMTLNKYRSTS